jgi:predicted negative regulator of RcsB-dependent stress response
MTQRRRKWTLIVGVIVLLLVGGVTVWAVWQRKPGRAPASAAASLAAQTVSAGGVEVTMTPVQLDEGGARFQLSLDTHSGSLDLKLPDVAQLRIAGVLAKTGSWDGAGPGGHHRAGNLAFATPVAKGASVQLRLAGLPGDVVATWTAP